MITKLKENNNNHEFFQHGDTVIAAVSGGPDSVALLHSLHLLSEQWEVTLIAVHVNHQLRGEDSEKDERYVQELCDELSIPLHCGRVDVTEYMRQKGVGLQVAARELRYAYLMKIAESYSSPAIATAHHVNDQAETLILRLLRGTSTSGLSGIPLIRRVSNVKIVRPFLPTVTREDIERYVQDNNLQPRLDKSNESRKYLRNKIRLDVMPELRALNPKIDEHLTQLALTATAENALLDRLAEQQLDACLLRNDNTHIEVDRNRFKSIDVALQRRMIKLILNHLTFTDEVSFLHIEHIRMLIEAAGASSSFQFSQHFRIYNDYRRTIFTFATDTVYEPFHYSVRIPGITEVPERNKQVRAIISDRPLEELTLNHHVAAFDFSQQATTTNWVIRSRLPGDRIKIDGLSGTKKVKDIFIDDKVSRERREAYPVITHNGEIVWIPGLRRSDYGKVSESTDQFLYLIWEDHSNQEHF